MSAEELYGSYSPISFAAQLKLRIPQSPQLKKMAPRRHLSKTGRNLPPELSEKLKTPPHETQANRKKRIQKIATEWEMAKV